MEKRYELWHKTTCGAAGTTRGFLMSGTLEEVEAEAEHTYLVTGGAPFTLHRVEHGSYTVMPELGPSNEIKKPVIAAEW